jgi:hypothetical protein
LFGSGVLCEYIGGFMNWVKFKQEHNWLSAVALFNILLAAIGPSFVEWDKPLGKVSNRSTQNSQRSSFERRINNSERNYKMELVKYKKFVYIPEPEGQAKLSKANFVGVLHSHI